MIGTIEGQDGDAITFFIKQVGHGLCILRSSIDSTIAIKIAVELSLDLDRVARNRPD